MDIGRWLKNQWDRTAAACAAVVGLVAIVLGWFGVSGAELPAEQIPYLASGAVGGLFALGVAATLWLSADLRDEWRRIDDIYTLIDERLSAEGQVAAAEVPAGDPPPAASPPVSANGRRRPVRTAPGRSA